LSDVNDARQRAAAVEARFRLLLKLGALVLGAAENWWSAAVPAKGGAELAPDLQDSYGIRIDLLPGR
jgi:hypothetical protein